MQAVNQLPLTVAGLTPDRGQLAAYQSAFAAYGSACDVVVGRTSTIVTIAQDAHDVAERTLQVAGAATLGTSLVVDGAAVLTEQGSIAFAKAAAAKIASLAVQQAATAVAVYGLSYMAQMFGVSPDTMRMGADALQLLSLLSAARAERLLIKAQNFPTDVVDGVRNTAAIPYLPQSTATSDPDSWIQENNYGTVANNLASEGQLEGLTQVQGYGEQIPSGSRPDYYGRTETGGTIYGDLYEAGKESGIINPRTVIRALNNKAKQTNNGFVILRLPSSTTDDQLDNLLSVIRASRAQGNGPSSVFVFIGTQLVKSLTRVRIP